MGARAPAGPGKSVAVTALGLATLLLGAAYAALAGQLIFGGVGWFVRPNGDPWAQIAGLFGLLPALIIVVGVAFLPLGALGVLAGLGVLWRKPWGRTLAFVLAVPAALLGLLWAGGADGDATEIALGAAQVLYGLLTLVVLIRKGAEFFRPRA
jgi:hypothetical protein